MHRRRCWSSARAASLFAVLACDPDDGTDGHADAELGVVLAEDATPRVPEAVDAVDAVDELHAPVRPTMVYGTSYTVWQGQPSKYLGARDQVICWLIEVGGDFEGHQEAVWIEDAEYFNAWYLHVDSAQSGVMGTAHCIPRTYYGQTLNFTHQHWSSGQAPRDLGSAAGRVCFLSSVIGKFEGSGEYVRTYPANGRWYLDGGSQQSQGVSASAVCMNTEWLAGPYHWSQNQAAVKMKSASDWVCGLSRVIGKLKGGGERVRTPVLDDGFWYLTGFSQQVGVGGSAFCI